MKMIVVFGSMSLKPCSAFAVPSHPALVQRASLKWGRCRSHCLSYLRRHCSVHQTSHPSPVRVPLTSPSSLLRAVILPNREASTIAASCAVPDLLPKCRTNDDFGDCPKMDAKVPLSCLRVHMQYHVWETSHSSKTCSRPTRLALWGHAP